MSTFKLSKSKQMKWDCYPCDGPLPDDRFSDAAKAALRPFARTKTGSLLCYWNPHNEEDAGNAPIVWIDSEAMPNEVICKNIGEFKKLIPYGTSLLKQLVILIKNYASDQQLFIPPDIYFQDWCKENNLKQMLSEHAFPDPVKIIRESMNTYAPIFREWFINNTK